MSNVGPRERLASEINAATVPPLATEHNYAESIGFRIH